MKFLFVIMLGTILSAGCMPYYQVFHLESEKSTPGTKLVFENEDIKVGYNFWAEYGNSSFAVYNKSLKPIYIDLGNTHFVLNDVASTYFQNRSFTAGKTVKQSEGATLYGTSFGYFANVSVGSSVESTNSETVNEVRIVAIPPKTMKIFSGFIVNQELYNESWFAREKNGVKEFSKAGTPISIKNVITYRFDENKDEENILFENVLWLKTVKNYKQQDVDYMIREPRNFYIKYRREKVR